MTLKIKHYGNLPNELKTLPYVGGKTNFAGAGPWVAELLNRFRVRVYVEPFAGCLGILLRRQPSGVEIVGDADDRIADFFRVVRDSPEAFTERLALTPYRAKSEFERAKVDLDNPDRIIRAAAVFTILRNSMPASLIRRSTWVPVSGRGKWKLPRDVYRLSARLLNVRIDTMDGIDLLRRHLHRREQTLIYCDPPYPHTMAAYDFTADRDALLDALLARRRNSVKLAVSGYSDSWDELTEAGWRKYTREVIENTSKTYQRRVEALWVSEPVPGTASEGMLI